MFLFVQHFGRNVSTSRKKIHQKKKVDQLPLVHYSCTQNICSSLYSATFSTWLTVLSLYIVIHWVSGVCALSG